MAGRVGAVRAQLERRPHIHADLSTPRQLASGREGAADGAGLGIQFLRHLSRTRLLLHLVDVSPYSNSGDPVRDVAVIFGELTRYSAELAGRERWLVLNKLDLLPVEQQAARRAEIIAALDWSGPVFGIAAIDGTGTEALIQAVMARLEEDHVQQES